MCHHFIGFQTYDRLLKPRAMWRCSACGRESQMPIDCCVQPAFGGIPRPGMGQIVYQGLRSIVGQAIAGLAAIRRRHFLSTVDVSITGVTDASIDVDGADPMLPESDTAIAELEETTHALV